MQSNRGVSHPSNHRYLSASELSSHKLVVLTEFFSEGSLRLWVKKLADKAAERRQSVYEFYRSHQVGGGGDLLDVSVPNEVGYRDRGVSVCCTRGGWRVGDGRRDARRHFCY